MSDPASSPLTTLLTILLVVLLVYRALMAVLREAFHSLPSIQRRRMLEEEEGLDLRLERFLEHPHPLGLGLTFLNQALLVAILVTLKVVLGTYEFHFPGGIWGVGLLVLVYLWFMDLVVPALLVSREPSAWLIRIFPFYAPLHPFLVPLVAPLARRVERLREAWDRAREEEDEGDSDDGVEALLEEGEAEGILEEEDRELIRNVVGFGDTVVREVMTPRTRIQAISEEATAAEVWAAFRTGRHSRLPVYRGTIDQMVGVLLLKDLMQQDPGEPVDLVHLAKPPIFVPESKPTLELLRELQKVRSQLALAVDEFGSISGLVTVEDLLEEVVGEIGEEHEAPTELQRLPDGACLVSGQLHVEDLEAGLDLELPHGDYDTVAGLLMATLGHIPREGEQVEVERAILTVLKMEGPQVLQVQVRKLDGD
nr:hemolysin family protein [uncultured Holophaga sp.]